jgi:hypothetical protein
MSAEKRLYGRKVVESILFNYFKDRDVQRLYAQGLISNGTLEEEPVKAANTFVPKLIVRKSEARLEKEYIMSLLGPAPEDDEDEA